MSYGQDSVDALSARGHLRRQDPARVRSLPTFPSNSRRTIELVINLKTAKALGLAIPPPLLLRADDVIQ